MGIDLRLEFKTKQKFNKKELADFDYKFNEANDRFGTIVERSDRFIVKNGYRYYGEGYERGPFPVIYMAIQWLRFNLKDVEIFYGGDCDDELNLLNKDEEAKLFSLWACDGSLNYRQAFNRLAGNKAPYCPTHTTRPMTGYSFSQKETGYKCLACNYTETVQSPSSEITT